MAGAGATGRSESAPTALTAVSFACLCYAASRLLDYLGLHAPTPLESYPVVSGCCQVAVTGVAIAGVASALGRDLAKPLAAGPTALHQMLAAALSGSLGPVVAAAEPSHACPTLDSALPRVAAPRRVHALPPAAHATGPPRACQPRGEVASSTPAAAAESAAPADQRSALTLPPLASLSLGEAAGSWTSGALSALLNPLLAVCDSPPIEAMRRAMSSPGAPRATQGAAPRRRRAEGDAARDSSAAAATPQAGVGARFVTAPPERLAALRVLAARSAALDPARAASALGSLGLDDGAARAVRAAVTDEHLLQFGALLGEGGCEDALRALGAREAWGGGDALLGAADAGAATGDWERIVAERRDGIAYEAWRRPLRRGLYLYRTRAVLEGVRPADVRAFHLDDAARARWDEAATLVARVAPEEAAPEAPESCLQKYRSRFPRPMASREYHYARRVWDRPADGGCYALCRDVELPGAEGAVKGAVRVREYVSCIAIKAHEVGTELLTCYFEDSQVRPSIVKMVVPKSLWSLVQKYESALRDHARPKQAASSPASGLEAGGPVLLISSARGSARDGAAASTTPPPSDRSRSLPCAGPSVASRPLEYFELDAHLPRFPPGALLDARRPALRRPACDPAGTLPGFGRTGPAGARAGMGRDGLPRGRRPHARQTTWVKRIVIAAGISVLHAALPGRGL
ncbi:hypothetical protein ACKKBG_A16975 [Auxenochlorella protothecoides x Auxenochlorella symbiontica]